jgi:hypothetical protein
LPSNPNVMQNFPPGFPRRAPREAPLGTSTVAGCLAVHHDAPGRSRSFHQQRDHKSSSLALKKSAKTPTQLLSVGSEGNSSPMCFEASGKGDRCNLNLEVQMKIRPRQAQRPTIPPLVHSHLLDRRLVLRHPQYEIGHIGHSKSQ